MAGGFAANLTRISPKAPDDERKKCEDLPISDDEYEEHYKKTGEHCIRPKRDWDRTDIHNSCIKCRGASGNFAFMFNGNAWKRTAPMNFIRQSPACSVVYTDNGEKVN